MKQILLGVILAIITIVTQSLHASTVDAPPPRKADPLAAFDYADLGVVDFCFAKFCAAITEKDVNLAVALVSKLPKKLASLDLSSAANAKLFLIRFDSFNGAVLKSTKNISEDEVEITYHDKSGKEAKIQAEKLKGTWKLKGFQLGEE